MVSEPVFRMSRISKRFPGVVALDGVDLEVYRGETVALAGENGAGKSTLMKVLGGVYQPDGGEIVIDGAETKIASVADSIHHGIGFVHQELNVLDNLTVAENVYLGREPRYAGLFIDRRKLNADTQVLLNRLGLNIKPTTLLRDLSIAQQQMVEIAKALSLNARILIMDEPTSSLTLSETEKLLEVIHDLKDHGVSVLYISHRLGEIKQIADRVVVLRDGRNAGVLEREQIDHDSIVRLMVGRDLERVHKVSAAVVNANVAEVHDLRTRRYPSTTNSFFVRRGEILGLAGLVGAGRSEAAQAIFGVEPAVSASVDLDGKRVDIRSARDAIKNGVYLIPEDRRTAGLLVDLPVCDNIALPSLGTCSTAGLVSSARVRERADSMCTKLKVKTPSIQTVAADLSGGNQQKVVLAKWLALEPKLLIFDEPTRGIDVGAKAEIYQLMRELATSGVGIIMISSDMEEILAESDRIAVMHEGRITGILDRHEASEEAIMNLAVGAMRTAHETHERH